MTAHAPPTGHGADYWQGDGGRNWIANIDRTESMLGALSERLYDRADPQPGESVVDIGCGGGQSSRELARRVAPGGRVLGLDISDPILDIARSRGEGFANLEFRQGDAATAALDAGSFDLMLSRFGVMFFEDPRGAFAHLRAALQPEGRLVFMCWRGLEDNPWMAEPAAAALAIVPPDAPPDPLAPGPFALADAERTRGILGDAGWRDITFEAADQPVHWSDLDAAVSYLTEMGPAGRIGREHPEHKDAIIRATREVLSRHASGAGVTMNSGVWIVSARPWSQTGRNGCDG